jgi:putative endonuclease
MKKADLSARRMAEKYGRRSELLARLLLMLKGYRILGSRVRTKAGEIDFIARSPSGILCFVEVKARGTSETALTAVRIPQQSRIARAAQLYVAQRPGVAAKGVRFDVVTCHARSLPRHIPDAWRPEDWRGHAA